MAVFIKILNLKHIKKEEGDDENDDALYFFEGFECSGDEVLVESSPPASPTMAAARRAHNPQEAGAVPVRELIVIPALPSSMQINSIPQVSNAVVESVPNGDSSGQSSPTADTQHTYITVQGEGSNGVNYHVQYVDQDMYNQGHQPHMDGLRTYPVYGVSSGNQQETSGGGETWGGGNTADYAAYGVVVAGDEAEAPASPATPAGPPRMPPATVQWLLDHYETAEGVSLPRSTLYAHYLRHCATHRMEPVNAASFGKLIRSVFVGLRTRRLGTRGNSKYHYYGIRAKANAESPQRVEEDKTDVEPQDNTVRPLENNPVGAAAAAHRQYLGAVVAPEPPELVLDDLPEDVPCGAIIALRRHHRQHGVEFLEAVAALDTSGVERSIRAFWRRTPQDLCRRTLLDLCARKDVCDWLRRAQLELYQKAVELLLPDVLRPIPPQLTQSIRNFAKSLESALSSGAANGGAPPLATRAHTAAAGALAAALRRYTSLNHLAQAARAVLTNHHQIQQMLSDLNRVDFRVVREQAAWACSCPSAAHAKALEQDFKATLGRGATLEQWAVWLERCVSRALAPYSAHYTPRARKLLLDWSFYSSLVIRELTLRSAASFGSFHLIRLLFDEYVSYLVEKRVGDHQQAPPIAVMHHVWDQDETLDEDQPDLGVNDALNESMNESVNGVNESVNGVAEGDEGADPDDPDWEWADDDDDEDDGDCKRAKLD